MRSGVLAEGAGGRSGGADRPPAAVVARASAVRGARLPRRSASGAARRPKAPCSSGSWAGEPERRGRGVPYRAGAGRSWRAARGLRPGRWGRRPGARIETDPCPWGGVPFRRFGALRVSPGACRPGAGPAEPAPYARSPAGAPRRGRRPGFRSGSRGAAGLQVRLTGRWPRTVSRDPGGDGRVQQASYAALSCSRSTCSFHWRFTARHASSFWPRRQYPEIDSRASGS